MDPCKNETLLSALMDDELSPEQNAAIRRHMQTCPACRQHFEALQRTDAMVKGMQPLAPSADFDRNFWRKVADLENRRTGRSWLRAMLTGWRPVLASGLAAGIAAAIFIYTAHDNGPTLEEAIIAQNMELLQNYDVIDHLNLLEHWDAIETMKEPS
jgi:anti-sigma factor RsiW